MILGGGEEQAGTRAERQIYRRRRLMDIARLLPVLGALLLALPLLWPEAPVGAAVRDEVSMSAAIIYVFSVWVGLICACFVFSLAVQRWADHWTGGGPDPAAAADNAEDS